MTVRTIDEIFRDFVTDGVPASGPFNPHKPDIRDTLKALTEGSDNFPDNRVIRLNNANEGTANNIVVTASVAIPAAAYQVLYILNVTQENTGPVTVSGAINRDLVTNINQPVPAGYLTPGMALLCIDTGTELRLLSYGDAEAILAAAEAAALRAEQAAQDAEDAAATANGVAPVVNRAQLKALDYSEKKSAIIYGENGRNGTFAFVQSDLSAKVALDPQEGIYVPPASDPTGVSGAWVRQYSGSIDFKWFGAKGDGATDDTDAVQAALDFEGADVKGGTIVVTHGRFRTSALTIPEGVRIEGLSPWKGFTGNRFGWLDQEPAFHVDELGGGSAITLMAGSGVSGITIIKRSITGVQTFADAQNWTDTGIEAADDNWVACGNTILGFNRAVDSYNTQRMECNDNQIDCWNGIRIRRNFDKGQCNRNHAWPFLTAYGYTAPDRLQQLARGGIGFEFSDTCDWMTPTDNFSYGYLIGHKVENAANVTLISPGADGGDNNASNSRGILINGNCPETKVISPQCGAQHIGIYVAAGDGQNIQITTGDTRACKEWCMVVTGGDVTASDTIFRPGSVGQGVLYNKANSSLVLNSPVFEGITGNVVLINKSTTQDKIRFSNPRVRGSGNNLVTVPSGITFTWPVVASGGTVLIPPSGDKFLISGTTNIGNFTGGFAGRRIVVKFQGALTLVHSANLVLDGSANFALTAGTIMEFEFDGSGWNETSRRQL